MSAEDPSILIVNNCPTLSGIGRYTGELFSLLNSEFKLGYISLPLTEGANFPGQIVKRRMNIPFTSGWLFGSLFPKTAFDVEALDGIFHYGSAMIHPWKKDGIVTVLDLIPLHFSSTAFEKFVLLRNLKSFRNYSYVIAISDRVRKELIDFGFKEENVYVVYPEVSSSFFPLESKEQLRKELGLPLNKKLVISVSSATRNKNVGVIEEIMKGLGEDFKLIRVGSEIKNAVNFRNVTDLEMNKLYNASDVLLAPSLDEGFGYPPIEAQKTGLPVVANDIEIFRETLRDSAILVSNSKGDYIRGIKSAVSQEGWNRKSIDNSSRFRKEDFVKKMRNIYANAVSRLNMR